MHVPWAVPQSWVEAPFSGTEAAVRLCGLVDLGAAGGAVGAVGAGDIGLVEVVENGIASQRLTRVDDHRSCGSYGSCMLLQSEHGPEHIFCRDRGLAVKGSTAMSMLILR